MKRTILAATLALAVWCSNECLGAAPRFEKAGDHCYYLQLNGENIGAVVMEEGILIVNPPQEPDLPAAVEALGRLSSKAVRWAVFTDYSFSSTSGARYYAGKGIQLLASTQLRALSGPASASKNGTAPKPEVKNGSPSGTPSFPWILFDRQMHLYPSNLEVRIFSIQHKARTGGDVIVHVPAEKVLFVGDFFEAARYPDIDAASGSALGWIDGLKQVIDSVPILKSAIPQVKSEPKPEQEKPEEGILVIPAHGGVANLQNIKELFEVSQKLRGDISRAVRAGRTCDSFLASPGSEAYRSYGNFEPFATQLFDELTAARDRKR